MLLSGSDLLRRRRRQQEVRDRLHRELTVQGRERSLLRSPRLGGEVFELGDQVGMHPDYGSM